MKNHDEILQQLAAMARQAPDEPLAEMPPGFETRILARVAQQDIPMTLALYGRIAWRSLGVAAGLFVVTLGVCLMVGQSMEPSGMDLSTSIVESILLP
jgi:hypothetical protein